MLKLCLLVQPGGLWINLGPLLYHWADSHMYLPDDELSIEVSLEDVEHIAAELGFVTERQEMVTAAYAANIKYEAMLCLEMPGTHRLCVAASMQPSLAAHANIS